MPAFTFNGNDAKFDSQNLRGEDIAIQGPSLSFGTDTFGVPTGRPACAQVALSRKLPHGKGDLILCRVAVASQLWNNRDQNADKWPTASLVFDRPEGDKSRDVQKHDLKRVLVDAWSLSWVGQGPQELNGIEFKESIRFRCFEIKKTSLTDNKSTSVKLAE